MRALLLLLLVIAATQSSGGMEQSRKAAEPMLIDLAGDGIRLTDVANGIDVDIDGDGAAERVAWTAAASDDSFLAIDHNQNGSIEVPAELIGGTTGPPIGFALLTAMDGIVSPGRPERIPDRRPDGRIDKGDACTKGSSSGRTPTTTAGRRNTNSRASLMPEFSRFPAVTKGSPGQTPSAIDSCIGHGRACKEVGAWRWSGRSRR